jgi:hypothetical protein
MLNLKTKPSGLDIPIQLYQTWLYGKLKSIWGITDEVGYDSFGRIYKNKTKAGYIPEVFISSLNSKNTTNKEVYFDQTNHKAVTFFSVDPSRDYNSGSMTAKISLIFILNSEKVKPIPSRGTEEIKQDIFQLLHSGKYEFTMLGSESGFKNVFREFDGWITKDTLTFMDVHPMYCFKINFRVVYNIFDIN